MMPKSHGEITQIPARVDHLTQLTAAWIDHPTSEHAKYAAGSIRSLLALASLTRRNAGDGPFVGAVIVTSHIIEDAAGNVTLPADVLNIYNIAADVLNGRDLF